MGRPRKNPLPDQDRQLDEVGNVGNLGNVASQEVPTETVQEQFVNPTVPHGAYISPGKIPGQVWAKTVHLGLGLDLIGSKTSLNAKGDSTLEVTPLGVIATSGKNKRRVIIPWANIKGCELL